MCPDRYGQEPTAGNRYVPSWTALLAAVCHARDVETNADRTYPMPCPVCDAPLGSPVRVLTIKGVSDQFAIDMRCHGCNHRWQDRVGFDTKEKDRLG